MKLEEQLRQAFPKLTNQDFGHHASDLYVVAYPGIWEWLQKHFDYPQTITTFIGQESPDWNGGGRLCYEIPFAGNWQGESP